MDDVSDRASFQSSDVLGSWLDAATRRLEEHDKRIAELEIDMGEVRTYLGEAATKGDIAGLRTYIDQAINGILREALNAIPTRHAAIWGGIAALATAGILALSLLHIVH